jgi:hypothetical protein
VILKRVSKEFVHSNRFDFDTPDQLDILLRILQIVIHSLSAERTRLKKIISDLKSEQSSPTPQMSQSTPQSRVVVADRCPICGNGFKAMFYLDQHIFSHHQNYSELWRAIRTPRIPGNVAIDSFAVTSGTRLPSETFTRFQHQVDEREQRFMTIYEDQAARLARIERKLHEKTIPAHSSSSKSTHSSREGRHTLRKAADRNAPTRPLVQVNKLKNHPGKKKGRFHAHQNSSTTFSFSSSCTFCCSYWAVFFYPIRRILWRTS